MLAYGVDMDVFLTEFKKCIKSMVVKQSVKASAFETADTKRKSDRYIAMMDGMTEWESFGNFDYEVLVAAGLSPSLIKDAVTNKELIPYDMRSICMSLQRQYVIDGYVEENDYYRMLNGLPPIEADPSEYITLGANSYGLPENTPIHLMTSGQQDAINAAGLNTKLLAKYPNAQYLLHLGEKKISPYKARTALNYQIIYIEKASISYISNDFTKYYANARNYVMRGLYNNDDRNLYDSYDSFMGFVILIMAVNRVFSAVFKQGITREFYDDNLIRDLFACYNIPYEESIDLKYQRELAKKLNVLLQKKSSNNVLYDIKSLFNYNQVNIYQYHLMKDYRHDSNGDPIIIYKNIIDEDGQEQRVIDYENTFDIYFQKVNIASENIAVELTNPSNRVNYLTIVGDDPYWTNDSDLINKIYTNAFNSIITKYMSIDVAYDVSKLMYETCHAFRLILDAGDSTKNIRIKLPYVDDPVSLYDTVTFICALVCKKYKLTGEIPIEPWNIATVYGFNFKTDIDYLREAIVDDIDANYGEYHKVDPELLKYLKYISINTIEDVRKLYENMEDLRVFLDTAMRLTQDLEAYNAYKKIYNSLLITKDLEEVYTKNDGTYAHTFMELLTDRRPDLAQVVIETEDGELIHDEQEDAEVYITNSINAKLNKTLDILSDISEDLSELRFANEKTEIVNNIEKIINQMKSYTVDMQAAGILYIFDDPHMCMLKILDYMKVSGSISPDDGIDLLIDDVINTIRISNKYSDKIISIIDAEGDVYIQTLFKDLINFIHKIQLRVQETFGNNNIELSDTAANIYKNMLAPSLNLILKEDYDIDAFMYLCEHLGINSMHIWSLLIDMTEKTEVSLFDTLSKSSVAMSYLMALSLKEEVVYEVKQLYAHPIKLINEIWKYKKKDELGLNVDIIDILAYSKNTMYDMSKKSIVRDMLVIQRLFKLEDYIWLRDALLRSDSIYAKLAIDLIDAMGLIASDAIKQGIITNEEFTVTVQSAIPSYLNTLNNINTLQETKSMNRNMAFDLADYMGLNASNSMIKQDTVTGDRLTSAVQAVLPTYLNTTNKLRDNSNYNTGVKDALNISSTTARNAALEIDNTVEARETIIIKDKYGLRDDDGGYISAIISGDPNSLASSLAALRTQNDSLNNEVIGMVYGIDGSVEVIGRNNTLEADNSNLAPKGLRITDSLTIYRN